MKRSLVLSFALLFAPLATAQSGPVVIDAPISQIYIPFGYDDNDNVSVVMHGKFSSTCYTIGQTEAKVDHDEKLVKVRATALYYPDIYCLQSITPFLQEVKVGVLKAGDYKVIYEVTETVTRDFQIQERTTEAPDDHLYAPVENAYIDVNYATGKQVLKLQGHFPHMLIGCMVMKEIQTYRKPDDVLVVLPIAEIVDGPECDAQAENRSFEVNHGLAAPFHGEGLLHVRTLHGTSMNRFIDVPAYY
ncbi:MAG: hypothetical protein ACOH5I_11970 [Oligoflexus sp.]